MKRDQLGRWWTFSKPGPLLLSICSVICWSFWDPVNIRPSLSSSLFFIIASSFLFIFLPCCLLCSSLSFFFLILQPILCLFCFCLLDISSLQQSPCHKHSMSLDHLDFTKITKNCINLFTSSICILKNELCTVLMHEKKHDKVKTKSYGCA